MLYFLSLYSDAIPGANVFKYVSFRSAWGMITALGIAYTLFPWFIERMKKMRMEQIIREDGPESHRLGKIGTPTMGGVCILIGIAISVLIWGRLDEPMTWMTLIIMLGYGAIGFLDDYKKVIERSPDGLHGRYKLIAQFVIGGGVLAYGHLSGHIEPVLSLPFLKDVVIDFRELWVGAPDALGWLYPAFALFVLIAASNGVNMTDGLDGLAIGPVMTTASTYAVLAYVAGHEKFAEYLGVPIVAGASEITVFALAIVGAGLGFLWYNSYPASIFMGDVGSLSLGGTLGFLAIATKNELLFPLVGGIFVLENASVVIQVASFKMTGKRVFLMAPIHHHYEKKGWSEPKIIVRFWIISVVLALIALSTLKLR